MISQFQDSGMGYKPRRPVDDPNDPESRQFNQGQVQAPQSFADMQKNGQARPAPPSMNPIQTGGGIEAPQIGFAPGMVNSVSGPPSGLNTDPQQAPPSSYPQQNGGGGQGSGMEQQLKDAYGGYKGYGQFNAPQIGSNPFQDPTQGSPFSGALQAQIMGQMQNPSRYDNNVLQDAFKQFSGQIDDQYNGLDQNLRGSIASRGLGSIGDSSIGTADQRFQNLQRRSAKSDMASQLLRDQANTYGSDRAQAIASAMGYGNNQFGNSLAGWQANNAQNQQGFNNSLASYGANLQGGGQGFNERQQLLNNMLGYGQQSFQNQATTNQINNQQQQQYLDWLSKMQGGV